MDDHSDLFFLIYPIRPRRRHVQPTNSSSAFLLRRPAALESRIARWTVLALAAIGAAFLVWSAVIHLEL